jgi:hypothetical protein
VQIPLPVLLSMVEFPTVTFLICNELFKRYTIVVNASTKRTSVYCDECEVWVNKYEGDQLSTNSEDELLELIVEDHDHQVRGTPVSFEPSYNLYDN